MPVPSDAIKTAKCFPIDGTITFFRDVHSFLSLTVNHFCIIWEVECTSAVLYAQLVELDQRAFNFPVISCLAYKNLE